MSRKIKRSSQVISYPLRATDRFRLPLPEKEERIPSLVPLQKNIYTSMRSV